MTFGLRGGGVVGLVGGSMFERNRQGIIEDDDQRRVNILQLQGIS